MQNNHERVFFALRPKNAEAAAIATWQKPLAKLCGGTPVTVQNLHTTLVFIGNVGSEDMELLYLVAQEVTVPCFDLVFDTARYWGHNHIVFAAPILVPPQLNGLVHQLEYSLQRHHFNFDRRDYKPHVTLLRHVHFTDSPLPAMMPVTWKIKEFVLVRSVNGERGMQYETIFKIPFASAL